MSFCHRLAMHFKASFIGADDAGNRYFLEKRPYPGRRARRWVVYQWLAEASSVPAEWHSWLHYTTDEPIVVGARRTWQKVHLPNQTGTSAAFRPAGHEYEGGHRAH